ncbi:MAG: hypothetical protein A2Z27_00365 [candidate division Zixibacteria bacterium RBG_16_50_21]|nr:MAG: hypothetical protein A2Z27_00365 [candidate division Zixibacteria bacterium RBG_16_50_21]
MAVTFPFLTSYDPPGSSEGTLDPLGLYQIADQLAVQLVPAVRERMLRIRFLTAMAVGAYVIEEIDDDPAKRDASPYLIWEWLVVEALTRKMGGDSSIWGVPGMLMAKRALEQHGYLDARSYLKNPRIFGFTGVYKRLAVQLGLVDVNLTPGTNSQALVDAWARDLELGGATAIRETISRWSLAVRRSLKEIPPRAKPGWGKDEWARLAVAFNPGTCRGREKRFMRDLLTTEGDRRLGALPSIWRLQGEFDETGFREEQLHDRLQEQEPGYRPLLDAIRVYEGFARSLQDAFDVLKAEASQLDAKGFAVPGIASDSDFRRCVKKLHERFEVALHALSEVGNLGISLNNLFDQRFGAFAEPMDAGSCAIRLCNHHEAVQQGKSAEGKRPWFDRIGLDRIYIRRAYRKPRQEIQPGSYVHGYRGNPIRRFYSDLQ